MKRYQMFCQAESGPFADTTKGQGRILAILKMQSEISFNGDCSLLAPQF